MAVQTLPGDGDVAAFLDAVPNERRRRDAHAVVSLARRITGVEPALWGTSIVGFGRYAYRYASGHEGETARFGLAPRSTALVLYGLQDAPESADLVARLGGSTLGKGCVYVKDLAKVDEAVLGELVRLAWTTDRGVEVDG
jgi:hypothetical protein